MLLRDSSLSARRAWIEMTYVTRLPRCQVVALRKESVDRNMIRHTQKKINPTSLSARRAWIEIIDDFEPSTTRRLSLSARRAWIEIILLNRSRSTRPCRSPQGERG